MQPKDKGLIWDIKSAANEIGIFLKDISYNDFVNDKKTRYAIERQLLVIGEGGQRGERHLAQRAVRLGRYPS